MNADPRRRGMPAVIRFLVPTKDMIRDLLLSALRDRFANRGMQPGKSGNEIAIFPAMHPEVGNLTIWDDGDAATIEIGDITHGHFNPYDDSLTSDQLAERVTEEVIDFLHDLFADRVLLWKSPDGRSGGWQRLGYGDESPRGDNLRYLWSGPIS